MIGAYEFWRAGEFADQEPEGGRRQDSPFSTTGASTNLMVLGFQELYGIKVKPVATGNPVVTLTQVMSGQVDVGYSVPPFGVAELEQGKIRIVGRGDDLPALARQTVRFIVVNADALAKRPDAFRRYMQGYRETVDWMFSADPQAIAAYAKWAGVSESVARRTRDDFIRKQNALPDQISGLDTILADAVAYKFIPAPLGGEQVKTRFAAGADQMIGQYGVARPPHLAFPGWIHSGRPMGRFAHGHGGGRGRSPHSKCGTGQPYRGSIPPSPPFGDSVSARLVFRVYWAGASPAEISNLGSLTFGSFGFRLTSSTRNSHPSP